MRYLYLDPFPACSPVEIVTPLKTLLWHPRLASVEIPKPYFPHCDIVCLFVCLSYMCLSNILMERTEDPILSLPESAWSHPTSLITWRATWVSRIPIEPITCHLPGGYLSELAIDVCKPFSRASLPAASAFILSIREVWRSWVADSGPTLGDWGGEEAVRRKLQYPVDAFTQLQHQSSSLRTCHRLSSTPSFHHAVIWVFHCAYGCQFLFDCVTDLCDDLSLLS